MAKGTPIRELAAWRKGQGLTMEAAAAMIVVDGDRANKATWHGWESGKKVPKFPAMTEIERVTGVSPNAFYDRPDAGSIANTEPLQVAMI